MNTIPFHPDCTRNFTNPERERLALRRGFQYGPEYLFTVAAIDRYLHTRYSEKYNAQHKNACWNLQFSPGTLGVLIEI